MTSGPGSTGKTEVPPEDAIEEISGLLEMDELKGGESQADGSEEAAADAAHAVSEAMGDALDVSMETPSPAQLDSYLMPPPPVAEEPLGGEEPEAESGAEPAPATNLAYEDLLEKLVLPAQPAASEEPEASQETPSFVPAQPDSTESPSAPLANLFAPSAPLGTIVSDERTVVTANPLLAEEQEAAARVAENFILPAAPVPPPPLVDTPVVAAAPREVIPRINFGPSKIIQISYPMFGGMMLAAVLVGGVLSRLMAPTRVVVTAPPVQTTTLVAHPVVPAEVTQPANPAPKVVPLPTPAESPGRGQPAAHAATAQPGGAQAIQPVEALEEPAGAEARGATKAKVHHVAKAPRPPKSVAQAPKSIAPKPAPAKPAAPKKGGKAWVDPFAT